jgi:hypothetical protein
LRAVAFFALERFADGFLAGDFFAAAREDFLAPFLTAGRRAGFLARELFLPAI